jgi:hypothetical protein
MGSGYVPGQVRGHVEPGLPAGACGQSIREKSIRGMSICGKSIREKRI